MYGKFYFSYLYDCVAIFGVRRLDCALVYDGLSRRIFFAKVEVVSPSQIRSAKFKSGVEPPHSIVSQKSLTEFKFRQSRLSAFEKHHIYGMLQRYL